MVAVREGRVADAPAIARVHQESWRTTYGGILPAAVITEMAGRKSEAMWRRHRHLVPAVSQAALRSVFG